MRHRNKWVPAGPREEQGDVMGAKPKLAESSVQAPEISLTARGCDSESTADDIVAPSAQQEILGDSGRRSSQGDWLDYSYSSVTANKIAWKKRLVERIESDPKLKNSQMFAFPRT